MRTGFIATLLFLLCVNSNFIIAQKTYRSGFVVTAKGDTLTGLIQYEQGQASSKKCIFKRFDIAMPVLYFADNILGYGFKDGPQYESKNIEGENFFLECFVKGKVSLFALGSKLYIEKENQQLVELKKGINTVETMSGLKKYSDYTEVLADFTGDATHFIIPPGLKLNAKQISNLLVMYNTAVNADHKLFFAESSSPTVEESDMLLEKKIHQFGVIGALNLNLTTVSAQYYPNYMPPNVNDAFSNISIGGFYNFSLPNTMHDISFQLELLYSKKSSSHFMVASRTTPRYVETQYFDISHANSSLKLPISFRYSLPLKFASPYASIGFIYSYEISNQLTATLDSEIDQTITTYRIDYNKYNHYRDKFTGFISLGVKRKVRNNLLIFAETRAELLTQSQVSPDISKYNNWDEFKYDLYGSPIVSLVHKSPLISFMVGIGF
jgi:hypothetical protein